MPDLAGRAYDGGMAVVHGIIVVGWLGWLAYWLSVAGSVKRRARGVTPWWTGGAVRVAIVIGAVFIFRGLAAWPPWQHLVEGYETTTASPAVRWVGAAVFLAGLALAIWARRHLGRNWGHPMSLREGHELVTSGPYALVRHPIYAGITVALFGTALAEDSAGLLALAVGLGAYFLFSAAREDKLLRGRFPNDYPAYRRRTKLLIPFVL